jgi:hypothetical protein
VWSVSVGTEASCRSPLGPLLRFAPMSDHTERLAGIAERVSAAKEFL